MNEYRYVTALGKFTEFIRTTLHEKKVPPKVDEDWLSSVGYGDKQNDRRFIPILKELGFITEDGTPTEVYSDYRDTEKSKEVMLEATKRAYPELFSIYDDPFREDDKLISNLIKSKKNYSQSSADLATRTFKALAIGSGLIESGSTVKTHSSRRDKKIKEVNGKDDKSKGKEIKIGSSDSSFNIEPLSIVINIQLVLPNTTDKEVYSNLFSELRKFISKEK